MKYLKKWSILESHIVNLKDWEDFKDLVSSEIFDEFDISPDLVKESIPGKHGDTLYEPELHFHINERYNNNEPVEIIAACRNLHTRVHDMTGLYLSVNWSSQQVNMILCDVPNHYTILKDFDLQEVWDFRDRKSGGVCDLETALEIINYLNGFYTFCYKSDIELFKQCFEIMNKSGNCEIIFSLSRFKKERYSQKATFKFCLDKDYDGKYPIFTIDTNHTDSPLLRCRYGNYNWHQFSGSKNILRFLTDEYF